MNLLQRKMRKIFSILMVMYLPLFMVNARLERIASSCEKPSKKAYSILIQQRNYLNISNFLNFCIESIECKLVNIYFSCNRFIVKNQNLPYFNRIENIRYSSIPPPIS
mgnify:CR=1 FL=1